jgi:hypothetical protein
MTNASGRIYIIAERVNWSQPVIPSFLSIAIDGEMQLKTSDRYTVLSKYDELC